MDFLKIVRSIEELLYEAMTWLLFYPQTLWRCLRHPDWIIGYTDKELGETPGDQFTDMISPPLFLIISIMLAHGIGLWLGAKAPPGHSSSLAVIAANSENLLIFRALFFSVFPLAMSAGLLHTRGTHLDRDTLRSPFYLQCYLAAPFAVMISTAAALVTITGTRHHQLGLALFAVAVGWYLWVQTRWFFHQIEQGWWGSFGLALRYFALALTVVIIVGVVIVTI